MRDRPSAAPGGNPGLRDPPGADVTPAAGPDFPHATSAPISRKLFSARKEIILYAQKLFGITGSAHQQSRQPHAFYRTGSRGTHAPGNRLGDRQCPLPPRDFETEPNSAAVDRRDHDSSPAFPVLPWRRAELALECLGQRGVRTVPGTAGDGFHTERGRREIPGSLAEPDPG
jgi:hypothetical protein